MTTHIIRIDPDGSVTELDGDDLLGTAREAFDGDTSTFTCHPITDGPYSVFPNFTEHLVGVCHDRAHEVTPVCNPKAWALYGRSPIAGPVFVAHDQCDGSRNPLDPEWIARLRADDWLVEGIMNVSYMQLLAKETGLTWPPLAG